MKKEFPIAPEDQFNWELVAQVHPPDWANPVPASCYDLVVIGAGSGGLVTAIGAASLGARTALVERHLLGGDCLNFGCVPSKGVIRAARAAEAARNAGKFGARIEGKVSVDFPAVMERMRRLRAGISHHDSAARMRDLGIDVFLGDGRFTGRQTVEVGGQALRFRKAVIATGGRAMVPPVEGLKEVGHLTNETVFSLTELPARLAVIGGGPIGCELAQAFAHLGSRVAILQKNRQFLPREDPDAAAILFERFQSDGIEVHVSADLLRVESTAEGKVLRFRSEGTEQTIEADAILVAAGRQPNVEGLGLEAAGVAFDRKGVTVDETLRTSNSRIFAAGDVCLPYQFTHMADFAARTVIQNACFSVAGLGRKKWTDLVVPWCTYTSPEIAHVGLYEHDAAERGIAVDTYTRCLKDVDRAILDGETEGFVKILTRRGTDEILGSTIVAEHAGDMIGEIAVAMKGKVGLGAIASTIHPYPTQAEAIRQTGDAYNRTRLTPRIRKFLAMVMKLALRT